MKRILPILALAAISSFAGGLKYGADAAGVLTMPSFSGDGSPDSKIGFGGKIAVAGQYDVNELFSVRGNVGYLLTTWGFKRDDVDYDAKGNEITTSSDVDATSHFVTIGVDAIYKPVSKFQILAGPSIDIPVSGSYSGGISGDIEDDQASVSVEAGLGYEITPDISVNAKYKLALTDYIKDAVKLNQVQVDVSYNFGN